MAGTEENRRLLIVEDDDGMQRQLRWHFEGWEVLQACDRESALAEVRRSEPAVVLQDLGLPTRGRASTPRRPKPRQNPGRSVER